MHLTVRFRRRVGAAAVAVLLSLPIADAGAQSCAAPTPLVANGTQFVNTCSGDASLVATCWSTFALAGRAGVLSLSLPYPAGTITVTPQNVSYDPAVFLLPIRCNSTAGCATAVDSVGPGLGESSASAASTAATTTSSSRRCNPRWSTAARSWSATASRRSSRD